MDMWDDSKPISSKVENPEKKLIKVNFPYETMFKEADRDVLGTHLAMKIDNLEKWKTFNK